MDAAVDMPSRACLSALYAVWDKRRNGREFPSRFDFEPGDLKDAVGHLSMIEVLRHPVRFRLRVCADILQNTEIALAQQAVYVNQRTDHFDDALATYVQVIDQRKPAWGHYRRLGAGNVEWNAEVLILPLSLHVETRIDLLMECAAPADTLNNR